MTVFSESQKTQIRYWFGASRLYVQLYPALENSMQAVLAVSDGGTSADDSAVTSIIGWLGILANIETSLTNLYTQAQVVEAGTDKVVLNILKGAYFLKQEGRRYVGHISDTLGLKPIRDVWSSPELQGAGGEGVNTPTMSTLGF